MSSLVQRTESLRHGDILSTMFADANAWAWFAPRLVYRSFSHGEIIFHQEQEAHSIYLILSGVVKTFYLNAEGKEFTVGLWTEGGLIGAPDLHVHFGNRCLSAKAFTDATLYEMRASDVEEAITRFPAFAVALVRALSFKVRWVAMLTKLLATQEANNRLAELLWLLCEIYANPDEEFVVLKHRIPQQELASMIGCSRQWVAVILEDLRADGTISIVEDGRLKVHIRKLRSRLHGLAITEYNH